VAHHAPFDIGFVSLHSLRSGLTLPETPILDSCIFARKAFPEMASHKLERLVHALGIGSTTFHRAQADAKSCAELFRLCVQKTCGAHSSWDDLISAHGKALGFRDTSSARPIVEKELSPHLQKIAEAVEGQRTIWMRYEGSYGPREVTPHLIYAKGSMQYLEATCHLDGIRKNFRLDRIQAILENSEV
jgi:DNA polymerase-3 subunit epsilon